MVKEIVAKISIMREPAYRYFCKPLATLDASRKSVALFKQRRIKGSSHEIVMDLGIEWERMSMYYPIGKGVEFNFIERCRLEPASLRKKEVVKGETHEEEGV